MLILTRRTMSRSIFGTSHGCRSLEVSTAHVHLRRAAWFTRIRQLRSQAAAYSGDYSCAWRSTFKDVWDYYDRGIALVVDSAGTAEFTNIQGAIDRLEPDFNTKRETIGVTGGIQEEKVIIPAIMPRWCFTMQGEGRILTITSWHGSAASARTLMSASAIAELCDHFKAGDTSFRVREKDLYRRLNMLKLFVKKSPILLSPRVPSIAKHHSSEFNEVWLACAECRHTHNSYALDEEKFLREERF